MTRPRLEIRSSPSAPAPFGEGQPGRHKRRRGRWLAFGAWLLVVPFLLSCYTITLNVQMKDTGEGTAWVYFDYLVPKGKQVDPTALNALLAKQGWNTEAVADQGGGQQLASGFKTFEPGKLDDLIKSVPGFEGTASTMSLNVDEDPTLKIKRYTFLTHLDMSGHLNNWSQIEDAAQQGISQDCSNTPLATAGQDCTLDFTPQEVQQLIDQTGPPHFQLKVELPGTLESDPVGSWTDRDNLKLDWYADTGSDAFSLKAVTVQHPETSVSPDVAEANLQSLVDRFMSEPRFAAGDIAKRFAQGKTSLLEDYMIARLGIGRTSNILYGERDSCGTWQTRITDWLDSIRLSPDPAQRATLAGVDYGPILAYAGGHHAVVVFPKGTDWTKTGTVLDPWPYEVAHAFPIAEWKQVFKPAALIGIGLGAEKDYPQLLGGPSSYPDTKLSAKRLHFRRLVVNSPVDVLITDSQGHRIGALPDGTIVNEIPGADFYPATDAEPKGVWYFGLPEEQYTMQTSATGSGDMHVIVAGDPGEVVTYGAVPVSPGKSSTLQLAPGLPVSSPLRLEDGTDVTPQPATVETLQRTYGNTPTVSNAPSPAGSQPASVPGSFYLPWQALLAFFGGAGVLAACCAIPAIGIAAFLVIRRRRRARNPGKQDGGADAP